MDPRTAEGGSQKTKIGRQPRTIQELQVIIYAHRRPIIKLIRRRWTLNIA